MKVDAAGDLQTRYARISDRFKATWTSHQFASGVFGQILGEELPYEVDFKHLFERIKSAGRVLNGTYPNEANTLIDQVEEALEAAAQQILTADARLSPSLLRRFFDRLKRPDDTIVACLIKFYLYADAVEGDRRDKLDLLFTRIGEDFHPEREEFVLREPLGLRQRIIELVSLLRVAQAPRGEVIGLIRAIKSIREDIEAAKAFDDFAERNLLKDARTFKHRVGDLYFDPDVLMAVIEMNVAAKNRFHRLYGGEERRLVEDADKLMQHGDAIERNFGDANPALAGEFAQFRVLREQFDSSRAQSNVKHEIVARLKASMNTIMAQLDSGLDPDIDTAELPPSFFEEARRIGSMTARFGSGEPLLEYVLRIDTAIEASDPAFSPEEIVQTPVARGLRLEPWEVAAYQKLVDRLPSESDEDNEELWLLYLRAAALRLKIDEEATLLASAAGAEARPEPELLAKSKKSLDLAKALDEQFGDFLQEAVYYSNRRVLHQLYRSRFRLLRGFSGLWLIYDQA
jgi:hypothetical protein